MQVYGQSKLANILFTKKLSNLIKSKGVTVNCLHPGFVSTSLGTQNKSIIGNLLFNLALVLNSQVLVTLNLNN